jgi:hypothetical protein
LLVRVQPGELSVRIVIDRRYRGPAESGNGGYTCGVIAGLVAGDAEVTLRLPPPLETPLRVEREGRDVRVLDDGRLVAEARPAPLELEPPEPVPFELAAERSNALPDDARHPFPDCFVCGPARAPGDALRLKPAPVGGRRVAAVWVPTEEQAGRRELVWAALDCPGAFAVDPQLERGISVLGRLNAHVERAPEAGEHCVVLGWPLGEDGRKRYAGTALFDENGQQLGLARATWIVLR